MALFSEQSLGDASNLDNYVKDVAIPANRQSQKPILTPI